MGWKMPEPKLTVKGGKVVHYPVGETENKPEPKAEPAKTEAKKGEDAPRGS